MKEYGQYSVRRFFRGPLETVIDKSLIKQRGHYVYTQKNRMPHFSNRIPRGASDPPLQRAEDRAILRCAWCSFRRKENFIGADRNRCGHR